jgi:bifunctional non-homologous end joining protein LigD
VKPVLVGGVTVTHPDRVVYPDAKLTKLDVIRYYVAVADRMLPLVANRPLSVVRCPDGLAGKCFYQKHVVKGMPKAVGAIEVREGKGTTRAYPVITDVASLVGLVQMNALEIHHWGASTDDLEKPDLVVFDLDPDAGLKWDRVVEAALALRDKLDAIGMKSWLKTTGGKGLHVVVPIVRRGDWDSVRGFSLAVVESLARDDPSAYTLDALKVRRKDRIFLDYLRNGRGATAIAAYSTRARPGAPIAMPISWEDLEKGVDPSKFTVATVPDLIGKRRRDPWKDLSDQPQRVTAAVLKALGQ